MSPPVLCCSVTNGCCSQPHPAGTPSRDTMGQRQQRVPHCIHLGLLQWWGQQQALSRTLCLPRAKWPHGPHRGTAPTSHMWSWKSRRSFCMSSATSAADGSAWMTPAKRARSFSFSIFPLWDRTVEGWGQPCSERCPMEWAVVGMASRGTSPASLTGHSWTRTFTMAKLAPTCARLQPWDKTRLCGEGLGGFCWRQQVPYTLVS